MRKIIVNGQANTVRTLTPFAYKDPIKSLDKSNEARVTLDGAKVHVSCVTSGIDVKARTGRKYHLYFYTTPAAAKVGTTAREFMPISAEEFAAYKNDPAFVFELATVQSQAAPEQAAPEQAEEQAGAAIAELEEAVAEQAPAKQARRAKR